MLAERLYRSTVSAMGSGEHLQIAGFLKDSRRTVVDPLSCEAVRRAFTEDPWSFESNLDALLPPEVPRWIEWPNGGEPAAEGEAPRMTGCLFAPVPGEPGSAAVVTGWDGEGGARHAFAVAHLDFEQLYRLSFGARTMYSRTADESLARLLGSIGVSMPSGFSDELDIVTDGDGSAIEAAMRDATADVPFALAMLVALASEGGPSENGDAGTSLRALRPAGWLERLASKAGSSAAGVFRRSVRKGRPRLDWRGAASAPRS